MEIPGSELVSEQASALIAADPGLYKAVCQAVQIMSNAFACSSIDVSTDVDMEDESDVRRVVVTVYSAEMNPVAKLRKVQDVWSDLDPEDSVELSVRSASS